MLTERTVAPALLAAARDYSDEQAGVAELIRVVHRMTGVTLEVGSRPKPGLLPIYVGTIAGTWITDLTSILGPRDALTRINDRFLVCVRPGGIALVGARPWATRLAITQFLEDAGARWYGPSSFFELTPQVEELTVPAGYTTYTPEFELRLVRHLTETDLVHLKLSRPEDAIRHEPAWDQWIGKERMARPELRGLVAGQRTGPLEYAHPDVPPIMARHILAWEAASGQRLVSLTPDAGPLLSESPAGQAWHLNELASPFTFSPAVTDAVMRLNNRVIPHVLAQYPETQFGFRLGPNTLTPPRFETVHPALAIFAVPFAENALVPTTSERDPRRSHFRQCLEQWRQITPRVFIFGQDPLDGWLGCLSPRVELLLRNLPSYKTIGVRGFDIDSRPSQLSESGLNIYAMSRLFWNTRASMDLTLAEFTRSFYGPGTVGARQWIRITQEAILRSGVPLFGNADHNIRMVFSPDVMAAAGKAVARAEYAVEGKEPWQTRVRVLRLTQNLLTAYSDYKSHLDACEFSAAITAVDRMLGAMAALHQIHPALHDPQRADIRAEAAGSLGGIRKQLKVWAGLAGEAGHQASGTVVQRLPRRWAFAFDPYNVGTGLGRNEPPPPFGPRSIDISQPWDYQGCDTPAIANGRYMTTIQVPQAFAGKSVYLCFTRICAAKIQLFVDGTLVADREMLDQPEAGSPMTQIFDLTPAIRPGQAQQLKVRCFKETGWGGLCGGVFLYSPLTPAP